MKIIFFITCFMLSTAYCLDVKKNHHCKKKISKACFKDLSKVDQNRVKTKIQTVEQTKYHQEFTQKRGISSLASDSPRSVNSIRSWSCQRAHSQFIAQAYCYQNWDKH